MTREEFWECMDRSSSDCWLWTKGTNAYGYGVVAITGEGRSYIAHRLAWELHHGSPPGKLCVLHRCDIRHCCNPSHLFLGTRGDNIRDAVRKRRHKHQILTRDVAKLMLRHTMSEAGRRLNVTPQAIHHHKCRMESRVGARETSRDLAAAFLESTREPIL